MKPPGALFVAQASKPSVSPISKSALPLILGVFGNAAVISVVLVLQIRPERISKPWCEGF